MMMLPNHIYPEPDRVINLMENQETFGCYREGVEIQSIRGKV